MQSFELQSWEISGYYPYVPLLGMESPRLGRSITDWLPATVPGSVHADMLRAGWIQDPYRDMNSLQCEWVENKWWAYRTTFAVEKKPGCRYRLNMKGLDYKCRIYLNDRLLDVHEGSFTPYIRDITDRLETQNRLMVLFESAPDEESQAGHASHTHTQKSRFSYKWDFSTRMVPVGIWDRAYVEEVGPATLEDVWLIPEVKGDCGKVTLRANCSFCPDADVDRFELQFRVWRKDKADVCKREAFEGKRLKTMAEMELWLEHPEHWYPNGLGAQPLYEAEVLLLCGGEVSHSWRGQIGFKVFRWVRAEGAEKDALPYCLEFEHKRVYMKGVNLTPFDMLIGTVTDETYRRYLRQIQAANINLVRVNGVGLIEKEIFYRLCDEYGILVWQEFIQTSSSMDRIPPADPDYLKLLGETSKSAILSKRNHVSLACYSGGNELTDAPGKTASAQNANIRFLQNLVDTYDTGRMMFPTSASGPNEFLEMDRPEGNHDVHGPWNYDPQTHYRLFNQSTSMLHGELGAEGMAAPESLKRFLSREHLRVVSMQEDLVWRHHGDWWDPWALNRKLFGQTEELDRYARTSQCIQAEAIRYALESNRRRTYANCGSMMWAFNEPFPNVSNTCLVDYYGVAKMAYYAARAAYSPLHLSLRYEKLSWAKGETFTAQVYAHNSLSAASQKWQAELLTLRGETLETWAGTAQIEANAARQLAELRTTVDETWPEVVMLRLTLPDAPQTQPNEYFFSTQAQTPFASLWRRAPVMLEWQKLEAEGDDACSYRVKNCGRETALFVHADMDEDNRFVFCEANYRCLLPGESAVYRVVDWKKQKNWAKCRFEVML